MLREILNSQNNIREQIDTKTNTLKIESNNNYYLIKNLNQLQKVLDKILLNKIFVSTQEVNQILNKTIKLRTLYFYLATNLDNKYNQKNIYKCLDNITNYLNALVSLLKEREIN